MNKATHLRRHSIHDHWLRNLGIVLLVLGLLVLSHFKVRTSWQEVVENSGQLQIFLVSFLKPEWEYLPKLLIPLLETLYMSIVGTFIGVILAIPAAFLGTRIVTRNSYVSGIFKVFFSLVRTIPTLLLGAILVAAIGIGELTGVFTIAIFTFAMVSQLIYGTIETINLAPIEADESIGATRFQIAVNAIWPQINHDVYSYTLYAFEVNIRASAILGYVGAGGIGVLLQTALGFFKYGRASLIILSILVLVILTDVISYYIRKEVL